MWGKFSLSETDACDALSKTNIPVLIIHGNADTQAPLYMAYRLYNSCRSEKSLLIVNDAGHAESYSKDPDTYEKRLKNSFKNICKNGHDCGILKADYPGLVRPNLHK